MGKDAFFVHLGRIHLVMQGVGAVGHGDIAQHAHGDHLLRQGERLVLAADHLDHLLVAGSHVALGRDVDKQGRKHQFKSVLVAPVDGVGPGVFDLLELRHLGTDGRGDAGLGRCRGSRGNRAGGRSLGSGTGASKEHSGKTRKKTFHWQYGLQPWGGWLLQNHSSWSWGCAGWERKRAKKRSWRS